MIDQVRQKISELLEDGSVKGVVALVHANGHVAPCLFQKGDALDGLCLGDTETAGDARYPLNKILITLARQFPEEKFGVLVRGCDERGLYGLYRLNQLNPQKVVPVGIACPPHLAQQCQCQKPFPDHMTAGEATEGVAQQGIQDAEDQTQPERFAFWHNQFLKCVKCYGCRDICPMCFCHDCTLEYEELVSKGDLPVEIPVFHLVRAMHMADRCIDCGLCDEACPSDIPLRLLYKKTTAIMQTEFGFTAGRVKNERSPFSVKEPAPKHN